ncbi:hypothetical protein M514_27320, partial [Trichuris suis]
VRCVQVYTPYIRHLRRKDTRYYKYLLYKQCIPRACRSYHNYSVHTITFTRYILPVRRRDSKYHKYSSIKDRRVGNRSMCFDFQV